MRHGNTCHDVLVHALAPVVSAVTVYQQKDTRIQCIQVELYSLRRPVIIAPKYEVMQEYGTCPWGPANMMAVPQEHFS